MADLKALKEKALHKKTHTAPTALGAAASAVNEIDTSDQSQEAMKERAKQRAPHYHYMSPEEQWAEDKRLGILDWNGE